VLPITPSRATEANTPFYGTLGYTSISTDTLTSLDIHIPFFPDTEVGIQPELTAQISLGDFAVGINLGAFYLKTECQRESSFTVGAISVNGKGRFCMKGEWDTCFGGQLSLAYIPDDNFHEECDICSNTIGFATHLRLERFGYESSNAVVTSPQFLISTTNGLFFLQAHFGVELAFFSEYEHNFGYDIVFGILGSVNFENLVSLGIGFRFIEYFKLGIPVLTGDLSIKMHFGHISPHLMISAPYFSFEGSVVLSVGVTATF